MGRKKKQALEESTNQDDQETSGTRKSNRKRKLPVPEESDQSDHDTTEDTINDPQEDSDNQDSHNLSDKKESAEE